MGSNEKRDGIWRELVVYESSECIMVVGCMGGIDRFRVLEIIKGTSDHDLQVHERTSMFDQDGLKKVLNQHKMKQILKADACLGLTKLKECSYLVFVCGKETKAIVSDRQIYAITETKLIPITKTGIGRKLSSTSVKYQSFFEAVDMSQDFYFSYQYDVTNTLQANSMGKTSNKYNEKYLWNYYWMQQLLKRAPDTANWLVPLVHGSLEQQTVKMGSLEFTLAVFARRSRHHAGTRFNRRGINQAGHVANEVETEQILEELRPWSKGRGRISSVVMIRGSIPLFWGQQNVLAPKPDIILFKTAEQSIDTTRQHFDNLFQTYGFPITCLNLIKMHEKKHQEIIVGDEFQKSIGTLSAHYREEFGKPSLFYMSYDFLNQAKAKRNVTADLFSLANSMLEQWKWYSRGGNGLEKLQKGVLRINCIDCLDRTNVAMFCVGLAMLGHQMEELGALSCLDHWEQKHGQLVELLQAIYIRHGDRIALQYGGSGAMHKHSLSADQQQPAKQQQLAKATGKVGNALTAIKRYYSNNFLDFERQHAMNIFLGDFIPSRHSVDIWDTESETLYTDVDLVFPPLDCPLYVPFDSCVGFPRSFSEYFEEKYSPSMLTSLEDVAKLQVPKSISTQERRRLSLKKLSEEMLEGLDGFDTAASSPNELLDVDDHSPVYESRNISSEKFSERKGLDESLGKPLNESGSQKTSRKSSFDNFNDQTEQDFEKYIKLEKFYSPVCEQDQVFQLFSDLEDRLGNLEVKSSNSGMSQ